MRSAYLIDRVGSFVDAVTGQEVSILYNVDDGNTHPNALVAGFLCDLDAYFVVFLSDWRF